MLAGSKCSREASARQKQVRARSKCTRVASMHDGLQKLSQIIDSVECGINCYSHRFSKLHFLNLIESNPGTSPGCS